MPSGAEEAFVTDVEDETSQSGDILLNYQMPLTGRPPSTNGSETSLPGEIPVRELDMPGSSGDGDGGGGRNAAGRRRPTISIGTTVVTPGTEGPDSVISPGSNQQPVTSAAKYKKEEKKKEEKVMVLGDEVKDLRRDIVIRRITSLLTLTSMLGLANVVFNMGVLRGSNSFWPSFAQWLVPGTTFLTIVNILQYYQTQYRFKSRSLDIITPSLSIKEAKLKAAWNSMRKNLCIEIMIQLLQPIPGRYEFVYSRYMSIAMIFRLYTLVRWLTVFSKGYHHRFEIFNSAESRAYNVQYGWQLALRVLFFRRTTLFFFGFTLLGLMAFAFAIFVSERLEQDEFNQFGISLWFMFITFTTIGYGDVSPTTTLGRMVTMAGGAIGLVAANLLAAVLANKLAPTPAQSVVVEWLDREVAREDYDLARMKFIQRLWRYRTEVKKMKSKSFIRRMSVQPVEGGGKSSKKPVVGPDRWAFIKDSFDEVRRTRLVAESLGDSANDNTKLFEGVRRVEHFLNTFDNRFKRFAMVTAEHQQEDTKFKREADARHEEMKELQNEHHQIFSAAQEQLLTQQASAKLIHDNQQQELAEKIAEVEKRTTELRDLQLQANEMIKHGQGQNMDAHHTLRGQAKELLEQQDQFHTKYTASIDNFETRFMAQQDRISSLQSSFEQKVVEMQNNFTEEVSRLVMEVKKVNEKMITQSSRMHSMLDTVDLSTSKIRTAQEGFMRATAGISQVGDYITITKNMQTEQKELQKRTEEKSNEVVETMSGVLGEMREVQQSVQAAAQLSDQQTEQILMKISDQGVSLFRHFTDRFTNADQVGRSIHANLESMASNHTQTLDKIKEVVEWISHTTNHYQSSLKELAGSVTALGDISPTLIAVKTSAAQQHQVLDWFASTAKQFHNSILGIQNKVKDLDTVPQSVDVLAKALNNYFTRTNSLLNRNLRNHWYELNHWREMRVEEPMLPSDQTKLDPKVLVGRMQKLKTEMGRMKLENQHLVRTIKELQPAGKEHDPLEPSVPCQWCGEAVFDDGIDFFHTKEHALCSRALTVWGTHKLLQESDSPRHLHLPAMLSNLSQNIMEGRNQLSDLSKYATAPQEEERGGEQGEGATPLPFSTLPPPPLPGGGSSWRPDTAPDGTPPEPPQRSPGTAPSNEQSQRGGVSPMVRLKGLPGPGKKDG